MDLVMVTTEINAWRMQLSRCQQASCDPNSDYVFISLLYNGNRFIHWHTSSFFSGFHCIIFLHAESEAAI